jgi:hypothetical protein
MIRAPSLRMTLIAATVLLGACGGGQRDDGETASVKEDAPLAGRNCGRAEGDSAQAVCTALNEAERIGGFRSRIGHFVRYGDTICVATGPADPRMVDGSGAIEIVGGRVVHAEVTDSTGCRGG